MTTSDATSLRFYEELARLMNNEPERYRILGDADMTAVFAVKTPAETLRFRLIFAELQCEGVDMVSEEEAAHADFRLEGPVEAWTEMFADITAHGAAGGPWTINSLALRGDRISCEGDDAMGLDRFSRFNQTLQEFLDGASRLDLVRSQS